MSLDQDIYYKKRVDYDFLDTQLKFDVSQELFSSQTIDIGTQRLLRSLKYQPLSQYSKALDLGCGYGPIGIALKTLSPNAEVHMVDSDALAVKYAQTNAHLNGFDDVSVYGSLGYSQVSVRDFDLIVSNIPAKVGEPVLRYMLLDGQNYLRDDGLMVVVVIDPINDFVSSVLEDKESIEILYHHHWPGHHVYHYRFLNNKTEEIIGNTLQKGLFSRDSSLLRVDTTDFKIDLSYNLPEFDQLSFETDLLLNNLNKIKFKTPKTMVFSVGQGHIPLAVSKRFSLSEITIVDRDLLALVTSEHNLNQNGVNAIRYHQVGVSVPDLNFDFILGDLPAKLSVEAYHQYLESFYNQLRPGGKALLASTSTVITRITKLLSKHKGLKFLSRDRSKGMSVVFLEKL